MPLKIITTEDGSHSLLDEELSETYHSTRGAMGESMHVFIKEGLEFWRSEHSPEEIKILEVGLGTGLNAWLTARYADENHQQIQFTSLEPFPIDSSIYEKLNYHQNEREKDLLLRIHTSNWHEPITLLKNFTLFKSKTKLEAFASNDLFDLIYFDAFAPSKQPGVWSLDNLRKCYALLDERGILTTYCAQGQFKRNLADAGFQLETLQGAMGKKEMVRGKKVM